MGLITGLLGFPLAPVRGTVWVAEKVHQQAENDYYDPARIKAELEQVDRRREAGELTDEEATRLEDELVDRLLAGRPNQLEG